MYPFKLFIRSKNINDKPLFPLMFPRSGVNCLNTKMSKGNPLKDSLKEIYKSFRS